MSAKKTGRKKKSAYRQYKRALRGFYAMQRAAEKAATMMRTAINAAHAYRSMARALEPKPVCGEMITINNESECVLNPEEIDGLMANIKAARGLREDIKIDGIRAE